MTAQFSKDITIIMTHLKYISFQNRKQRELILLSILFRNIGTLS